MVASENASSVKAILSYGGVDTRNVKTEVALRQHLGSMLIVELKTFIVQDIRILLLLLRGHMN